MTKVMTEAELGKAMLALAKSENRAARLPRVHVADPSLIGEKAITLLRQAAAPGGVLSGSDLAESMEIKSSTLSSYIAQLTVRGLLTKRTRDGKVMLFATDEGRAFLEEAR